MLDIESVRKSIVEQIYEFGNQKGVPKLQLYLGSSYPVLGLSVPQMRSLLSSFEKSHRDLTAPGLNALAQSLWAGPTYEEKSFAINLLNRYSKLLDNNSWMLTDRWVDEAIGWALCDSLGSGPVSTMVYQSPSRFPKVLEWTWAENFWRRRAAAYSMRNFVFSGELERPFTVLERLLYDKEFWVQRAVGTWLRECWKKDRRRTEAFLRQHVQGLPRVVITVATERAPASFREELRRSRSATSS